MQNFKKYPFPPTTFIIIALSNFVFIIGVPLYLTELADATSINVNIKKKKKIILYNYK